MLHNFCPGQSMSILEVNITQGLLLLSTATPHHCSSTNKQNTRSKSYNPRAAAKSVSPVLITSWIQRSLASLGQPHRRPGVSQIASRFSKAKAFHFRRVGKNTGIGILRLLSPLEQHWLCVAHCTKSDHQQNEQPIHLSVRGIINRKSNQSNYL